MAKVADFGLARQLKDGRQDYTVHSSVAFRWAAPEIFLSHRHSSASDVWAFGVLCWEVFSPPHSQPWTGLANQGEVIQAVVHRRQVLAAPRGCDSAMWAAVQPCFAYDAHKRPTFAQLHATLGSLSVARPAQYLIP